MSSMYSVSYVQLQCGVHLSNHCHYSPFQICWTAV